MARTLKNPAHTPAGSCNVVFRRHRCSPVVTNRERACLSTERDSIRNHDVDPGANPRSTDRRTVKASKGNGLRYILNVETNPESDYPWNRKKSTSPWRCVRFVIWSHTIQGGSVIDVPVNPATTGATAYLRAPPRKMIGLNASVAAQAACSKASPAGIVAASVGYSCALADSIIYNRPECR